MRAAVSHELAEQFQSTFKTAAFAAVFFYFAVFVTHTFTHILTIDKTRVII